MKKWLRCLRILFLLGVFLLCKNFLSAQYLEGYNADYAGYMWFSYPCTGSDSWLTDCQSKEKLVKTEYPPWIIGGGWRTYFFVDGTGSSAASSPLSMVTSNEINLKNDNPNIERVTKPTGCPAPAGSNEPWRLNYYGVYSAQYFNHPTAGTVSLGFLGGENHVLVGTDHQASIPVDCSYLEWDGHSAFLCGAWIPNNASTNWGQQYFPNDMGPIIWPGNGYFGPNNERTGHGCGNPSTIQADGYLYVFYNDESDEPVPYEPGRISGIKVARAPISDALNPLAYKTYYEENGTIYWNSSLPSGFNKNNIQSFLYGSKGPLGTKLLTEPGRNYNRFSVAKVANTNYYLGVGSYMDYNHPWTDGNGTVHIPQVLVLKYSYDLLHWFGDRELDRASWWATCNFNYPIFLAEDGWSNTNITTDFYIVGTNPSAGVNNIVHKMHVYYPPPPSICYDQCGNQVSCPAPPYCPDCWCPETRKAVNAPGAALDNSKERAPFVSPNPGNGVYTLKYTLKSTAKTQVKVMDLMGKQVQAYAAANRKPGTYTETINISSHAKGIYLLELLVNGKKQTFKVIYQ